MSDTLVYLYAVTAPDGGAPSPLPAGVEDRPVRALEEGDLVALVSDVPAAEWEQSALDAGVRDPAWLTPRAGAHQAVNAAAHAGRAATLPVPFATIFRGDERVREMLRTRADELRSRLASVRGRGEWVVGLSRDTGQAAEHLARLSEAVGTRDAVAAGSGRRYLEERRSEAGRREELRRLDDDAAAATRSALAPVSKNAFEEPIVEDAGDLVARTTYLVRRADEDRFRSAVERFNGAWRERGYQLRVTGPWPAYRSSGVTA